jgi:lipid A biosynthesis lauroyl/palmitoleoyl acyltransferase
MQQHRCGIPFSLRFLLPHYWLTWCGLLLLFCLAWLPFSMRHFLGRQLGRLIYKSNKKRRHIVQKNIQLCFPDLSPAQQIAHAKASLQWYGCALLDYSFFFFSSKKRLYRHMHIEGKEHIDQALAHNQAVMVLLGHSVMLEFVPAMLGKHFTSYGSYKPLSNPLMDWIIAKNRCKHVKFVISREQGMVRLVRELKEQQILIFLPDEDHGKQHSHFAPFFNVPKATLNTPARIAHLAKAKSFPAMAFYDRSLKKYRIIIDAALEDYPHKQPEKSAAIMNAAFEKLIQHDPVQYMWLLKLFKSQVEQSETRY